VLSSLLPAVNRLDYLPCRTMSRPVVAPLARGPNAHAGGT
jgi:hypothetical protein